MWIIRCLRLLFGIIAFKGEGGFLSRFINLCHEKRIPLWNLQVAGQQLSAQTNIKGYKKLRHAAKKSGVRIHATQKKGFPFLLRKNRMRAGLLAGLVIAMILYAGASQCLWRIEVNGNETIHAKTILAAAQNSGIFRGALKKNVVVSQAAIEIRRAIPKISWIAVNLRGCTAEIEVREQIDPPSVVDQTTPMNIIASRDGYVEQIHIDRGAAQVKNNETVEKGQLLISGIITKKDETQYAVHAQGACIARTQRTIVTQMQSSDYQLVSSMKKRKYLYFFGINIPLNFQKNTDTQSMSETDFILSGTFLPIGKKEEVSYRCAAAQQADLSTDESLLLCCDAFYLQYDLCLETCETLNETIQKTTDQPAKIVWQAACRENIAVEAPVTTEYRVQSAE